MSRCTECGKDAAEQAVDHARRHLDSSRRRLVAAEKVAEQWRDTVARAEANLALLESTRG